MWIRLIESFRPRHDLPIGCNDAGWLQVVLKHPLSPALIQMLDSLALVRFGFMEQNEQMRRSGQMVYGQALTSIQEALSRNECAGADQTLAAIRAAHLYEARIPVCRFLDAPTDLAFSQNMCTSSEREVNARRSHWTGLCTLVASREPAGELGELGAATVRGFAYAQVGC